MFEGKCVLVTGGSRGIGRAVVEELAARGANVAFTYNSGERDACLLRDCMTERYPAQLFIAHWHDASQANHVSALVSEFLDAFGRIDALVNNAGITRDNLMVSMARDEWSEVIDVNLSAVFHLSQAVLFPMMKQRVGSIISITSISGVHGNAGQVNYSAAKAGLIGFTKALAKEVVGMGIRVNAVAPGLIETSMTSMLSDATKQRLVNSIGMRRMGTPSEVAKAVAFLASDNASYITGQVLCVDGGIVI